MSENPRVRRKIEATRTEHLALTFTAACGVAMNGGVIAALIYILLALAPLLAVRPAIGQPAPVAAGIRLYSGDIAGHSHKLVYNYSWYGAWILENFEPPAKK